MYRSLDENICSTRQDLTRKLQICEFSKILCPYSPTLLSTCIRKDSADETYLAQQSLFLNSASNLGNMSSQPAACKPSTIYQIITTTRHTHHYVSHRENRKARISLTHHDWLNVSLIVRLPLKGPHCCRSPLSVLYIQVTVRITPF